VKSIREASKLWFMDLICTIYVACELRTVLTFLKSFHFIIFTLTHMCIHCLGHLSPPPVLTFLNGWKTHKEYYFLIWKLYGITVSVSLNKVLSEYILYNYNCILCMADSVLQQWSWVVVTEILWPGKPKYFYFLVFNRKKKLTGSYLRIVHFNMPSFGLST
jgi:hypothetical protein